MSSGSDARENFERMVSLAKGDKGDKGERGQRGVGMTRGARRAIVVLFTLTVALAAVNLLFTVYQVTANDHKFCQVVTGITAQPAPRAQTPTAHLWYERFVRLGRDLGC